MIEKEETRFFKKLQNMLWTAFGGILLLTVVAVVPFYFNTTNDIKTLRRGLNGVEEGKADKDVYELTVTQIKKELSDINKKLDEI